MKCDAVHKTVVILEKIRIELSLDEAKQLFEVLGPASHLYELYCALGDIVDLGYKD